MAERALILLAGGTSRRMGQDKATLPSPGGGTILERLIQRLSPVVELTIVAGRQPAERDRGPLRPGLVYVQDLAPGAGPLGGAEAGMRTAGDRPAWVVACDQPDVLPEVGASLFHALDNFDAAVPLVAERQQPLCAVYAGGLADRASAALASGQRSMADFLGTLRVRYLTESDLRRVDPNLCSFENLNTPFEYRTWFERELTTTSKQV